MQQAYCSSLQPRNQELLHWEEVMWAVEQSLLDLTDAQSLMALSLPCLLLWARVHCKSVTMANEPELLCTGQVRHQRAKVTLPNIHTYVHTHMLA